MKIFLLGIAGLLLELVSFGVVLLGLIWVYYDLGYEKTVIIALACLISMRVGTRKWVK